MNRVTLALLSLLLLIPSARAQGSWAPSGAVPPPYEGDAEAYGEVDERWDEEGPATEQPSQDEMLESFRSQLSPYGRWEWQPTYGWIWYPSVPGFRPYADGRWVYTGYGWTFDSDAPYGWAVFHYGRWVMQPHGWAWIPGYTWAPAWVSFRSADGYVGWSPLGPGETVYDLRPAYASYEPWVFVEAGHFGVRPVLSVRVPAPRVSVLYHRCAPIRWGRHQGVPVYREMPHVRHVAPAPLTFSTRVADRGHRHDALTVYRIDRRRHDRVPVYRGEHGTARHYTAAAHPRAPIPVNHRPSGASRPAPVHSGRGAAYYPAPRQGDHRSHGRPGADHGRGRGGHRHGRH